MALFRLMACMLNNLPPVFEFTKPMKQNRRATFIIAVIFYVGRFCKIEVALITLSSLSLSLVCLTSGNGRHRRRSPCRKLRNLLLSISTCYHDSPLSTFLLRFPGWSLFNCYPDTCMLPTWKNHAVKVHGQSNRNPGFRIKDGNFWPWRYPLNNRVLLY